jgi:hypothetical protein
MSCCRAQDDHTPGSYIHSPSEDSSSRSMPPCISAIGNPQMLPSSYGYPFSWFQFRYALGLALT